MSSAPDILGEPLTITEVARLIGVSVWTVRQRYLPSGLPYFRIGKTGKITFYRNQVVQWILENQTGRR
jgi:transcription initiation factor TFIIIB Brf1 subunit/transcription initiation factor TFIIB